jgi:transposase
MPKWQTVYVQRLRWTSQGLLAQAIALLRPVGTSTTVGSIDSTFIESAYGGALCAPSGYKRATGPGVHVLIDNNSYPLAFSVLPGNLQDAAGARQLVPGAKIRVPSLKLVLGDKAYRQRPLQAEMCALGVEINGDSPPLPKGTTFKPMPMRWRIEQFFAWLCKWRRIAKNWCFSHAGFTTDLSWALPGICLRRGRKLNA